MTMTVREMAEWLMSYEDQEALVQVIDHDYSEGGYYAQGGTAQVVFFNPAEHVDYVDHRGNSFVDPAAPHYNQRTVLIGRSE